jgi:hypothetical protein
VPVLRPHAGRTHAPGRLSVFLRMHGMRRTVEAESGGLLRVLLIRYREMPAQAGRWPGVRLHTLKPLESMLAFHDVYVENTWEYEDARRPQSSAPSVAGVGDDPPVR